MKYSPIPIIHICAGIIGILSGATALLVRKGSPLHRRAGKVFVISMLCMSASGGYRALIKSELLNVLAGVFTFYLVATAWLTVMRKEEETGLVEFGLLLVALAAGTSGWILGWEAANSPTGLKAGDSAVPYFILGSLLLSSAAGDIRVIIRGGITGAQRLARHLWRMSFALFIAAGSFFLGTASDPAQRRYGLRARLFTEAIRKTHLPELPVIIIALLMIFWLWRVLFTNAYKKPPPSAHMRRRE